MINSRSKGAAAEREVFGILNKELGHVAFKRNLNQSRNGGLDDDPTLHSYPVALEVKRRETVQLTAWMAQARQGAAELGRTPVVCWRTSHSPWRVLVEMSIGEFVSYLQLRVANLDDTTVRENNRLLRSWK